jgi:large subunit ribosomal protein L25
MTHTLKAEARKSATKSELKQLRSRGRIPAVVYGKNKPSAAIAIAEKELMQLLRSGAHGLVDIEMPEGGKLPVMISEMQKDTLQGGILHVDFHQVNMNEPVRATVAIEPAGEARGVKEGGILQTARHEIEIRGLPASIPDVIKVDVSELGIGETLLASQVRLPEGVELRTDPSEAIFSILVPQKDETQEAEADTAAAETPAGGTG